MDPSVQVVEHDGLGIGVLDWGGDGPPLLLLHPNGFCAGVFDPIAQRLRGEYRPIGVDVRGHGTSDAPKTRDECSFSHAAGRRARGARGPRDRRGRSARRVARGRGGDPARPAAPRHRAARVAVRGHRHAADGDGGVGADPPAGLPANRMAEAARRRRAVWPDRETVLASYGSRPPLEVFEPDALAGYVRWGFRDRPDGQVELSCPPEVEAWYFEGNGDDQGAAGAFAQLSSFSAPATVVCAGDSDLPPMMFTAQAEALGVELVRVLGYALLPAGRHRARGRARARAPQLVAVSRSAWCAPTRSRACPRWCVAPRRPPRSGAGACIPRCDRTASG